MVPTTASLTSGYLRASGGGCRFDIVSGRLVGAEPVVVIYICKHQCLELDTSCNWKPFSKR